MKHPVETNFIAPIPIPWWAYAIVSIAAVLLIWIIRSIVRFCRKPGK